MKEILREAAEYEATHMAAARDPLAEEILMDVRRRAAEFEASYHAASLDPPLPPPADPVGPDGGPPGDASGAVDLEMMD